MPLLDLACAKNAGKFLLYFGLINIVVLNCSSIAQTNSRSTDRPRPPASDKQIESDLKFFLNDYYTGKPVRAKVVIPANERGIEVIDGQLKTYPLAEMAAAVQPGEMVLIKELKFKNRAIEVYFNSEHLNENSIAVSKPPALSPIGEFGAEVNVRPSEATQKLMARKSGKPLPDPRVILRFSREIGTQDLNLQSINRLLSPAVDITSLTPNNPLSAGLSAPTPPRPTANFIAQQQAIEKGISIAPITGDLTSVNSNIGEITVECSIAGARLYIDGAYSGATPRTVQLTMGIHTILVIAPGYGQSEQKVFLPASKTALIKVELKPINK